MNENASYMPPVELGEAMRGATISRVIASRTPRYPMGALLLGLGGWQDYYVIAAGNTGSYLRIRKIPGISLPAMLGVIGITGLTAYFGVYDIGRPRRGDTFVVSAAAGAVGSIAGQLAKRAGARVVGIAGTPEKCLWLVSELRFDTAVCHRDADWLAKLSAACPNGIDVDFENAGGPVMDGVFSLLNHNARVVLCGLIADYDRAAPSSHPYAFAIALMRRVRIQGFIVLDYEKRFTRAALYLAQLSLRGKLIHRTHMVEGLENAPDALIQQLRGGTAGKVVVAIRP